MKGLTPQLIDPQYPYSFSCVTPLVQGDSQLVGYFRRAALDRNEGIINRDDRI
ncbi:MAG: hypothetical protein F6K14_03720 [Symploca sp. SIO2C1]|nr:hypothetical protein [Symploca sp. SIO2C1]